MGRAISQPFIIVAMWERLKKLHLWLDVGAFLVLFALALSFGDHTKLWYAGLILAAVCFPLWIIARIQLGSAFSLKPEARRLVTHGLYSRLQHPIYLFGCGAYLGALLALQVWTVLAVWAAFLPLEVVRAHRESRLLNAKFGEQYEQYRRSTWL
ncbi:MAG TPA: isoprenylcysteine carboxylmethyltransferase family protein [Pyrinomonadaceae bacterium]